MPGRKGESSRFTSALQRVDDGIGDVRIWDHPQFGVVQDRLPEVALEEPDSCLIAALARAACAAGQQGHLLLSNPACALPIDTAKKLIDGAATAAGERVTSRSKARLEIRGGEGVRDHSPGAVTGQVFGPAEGKTTYAVIDYVDGTGLVARGLPGALALGATSDQMLAIPDLKVFCVLLPRDLAGKVEFGDSPMDTMGSAIASFCAAQRRSPGSLRVLTHSRDVGSDQELWHSALRSVAGTVVVPAPISVEPPYLLAMARHLPEAMDVMIGVMGLTELVYGAALLDILDSDYTFVFRLVNTASGKRLLADGSSSAYHLEDSDRQAALGFGMAADAVHAHPGFVPSKRARMAAMFAVTECPSIMLPEASASAAAGIVCGRGDGLMGVTIHYKMVETDRPDKTLLRKC